MAGLTAFTFVSDSGQTETTAVRPPEKKQSVPRWKVISELCQVGAAFWFAAAGFVPAAAVLRRCSTARESVCFPMAGR